MKKSIFILLLVFLTSQISFGQNQSKKVDIIWGNELKASKKNTLDDVVGYDETGFYVKKSKLSLFAYNIFLEHYDKKMNLTKTVELNLKEQNKQIYYEGIIQLKDKLYCFFSSRDSHIKKNTLFMQEINKRTLQLTNDRKKVGVIDYSHKSVYNSGNFNIVLSRDSSKVLIYYNLPYEKNKNEKFGFHVFDSDMSKIWEREITLPYIDKLFSVEDYVLDNSGNVHLLGKIYKDKAKEEMKGEVNYKYIVLSYTEDGENLTQYPIKLENKFITDMIIAIDNNQNIVCSGFYSDERSYSIVGSFFLKIDHKTKDILAKSFKKFDIDFITQNMTERQEKKTKNKADKGKNTEMFNYDLDYLFVKDDGGVTLIGEQYYYSVVTHTSSNGSTYTTYHYYYNDIIVVNISPEGDIEWANKIAKRQHTVNDGGFFSSYALTIVGDRFFFIFNDNAQNLGYTGKGKVANLKLGGKDAIAVLVEVDYEGKQTREALFASKETGVLIRPKVCEQISDNQIILFGQRKKIQRFALAAFKD